MAGVPLAGGPAPYGGQPGGPIPVLDTTVKRLSANRTMPDCGDIHIAYYNLGLASMANNQAAPPKPNRDQIIDYIRRLVWHVTRPAAIPGNGNSEGHRRKKIRNLMMAIQTLRQIKNYRWDRTGVINVDATDISRNALNWNNINAVPAPLPWAAMNARLNAHRGNMPRRFDTFEPLGAVWLSAREQNQNSDEKLGELARYWDTLWGFEASGAYDIIYTFSAMNWPEDGNSLWYCLCYQHLLTKGPDREWAFPKYHIWRYFNYVIHHPSHPRHRMYVHLERQSWNEVEQRTPGSERLWGRMSILRALSLNTPNSGPPMYGHLQGMFQVIADFYQKEVILFIRPPDAQAGSEPGVQRPLYGVRVFGSRAHGQNNGQLYFVTDRSWEQFQAVTHMNDTQLDYYFKPAQDAGPPVDPIFNTLDFQADDRYGWIDARWMPARPLPVAYAPMPIPTWGYLDPRWVPDITSDEYWQWKGCGEGSSANPRYGRGAVPILPDPAQAGWFTERMAMGPLPNPFPIFPYGFGNRQIVTGVYEDANGNEFWPQWNNILAYRAAEYRKLALKRDLPTEPHPLSAP
ncbi:hypothetical protein HD806DRAFT_543717 [Xylariaceae sp. AK1471]|nr:hypothetical protein HD806DRAFT_543717 [Xylariaceae sp. AK1471]